MTSRSQVQDPMMVEQANPPKKRSMSNLVLRFATGLIIIPLMVFCVGFGDWFLTVPLGFLALVGILEFYYMEKNRGLQNNGIMGFIAAAMVLLAFHWQMAQLWQLAIVVTIVTTFIIEFARGRVFKDSIYRILTTVGGILYIAFPIGFLIEIRQMDVHGLHWFYAVIYSTWGTDTLAYLVGSMIGKRKFVPSLSPNKTLEGAIGGIFFGALLPIFILVQVNEINTASLLLLIVAPFAATLGDLFESAVKRFFGVKDSHLPQFNILPGHGGVLDRVDSILWVATVYYIFLVMTGKISLLL